MKKNKKVKQQEDYLDELERTRKKDSTAHTTKDVDLEKPEEPQYLGIFCFFKLKMKRTRLHEFFKFFN